MSRLGVLVVAFLVVAWAGVLAGQESEAPRPPSFSQPLEAHTLETLFPVRASDDVEEQIETGRRWQESADGLAALARARAEAASGQLEIKRLEVQSLRARRKAAKRNRAADELAAVEDALLVETHQVKALESVRELSVSERRTAEAWSAAGRALVEAGEAEAAVAERRSEMIAGESGVSRWSSVDPDTWGKARGYNQAAEALGARLVEVGRELEDLAQKRRAVLEEWKPREAR